MQHPTDDHGLLQEIEEDLQRQKIEALWKRFGPAILSVVAIIVLGTALVSGWRSHKISSQQERTAALFEILLKEEDQTNALAAFADSQDSTTQALLARLHEAALWAEKGEKEKAIGIYSALAADTSFPSVFRELAVLLSVQDQMDTSDPARLQAQLEPLMKEESAWHLLAMESAGYLALRAGNKNEAKALFTKLAGMPDITRAIAHRVSDILVWLEEDPS